MFVPFPTVKTWYVITILWLKRILMLTWYFVRKKIAYFLVFIVQLSAWRPLAVVGALIGPWPRRTSEVSLVWPIQVSFTNNRTTQWVNWYWIVIRNLEMPFFNPIFKGKSGSKKTLFKRTQTLRKNYEIIHGTPGRPVSNYGIKSKRFCGLNYCKSRVCELWGTQSESKLENDWKPSQTRDKKRFDSDRGSQVDLMEDSRSPMGVIRTNAFC
jgi:hypothetical protein